VEVEPLIVSGFAAIQNLPMEDPIALGLTWRAQHATLNLALQVTHFQKT